MKNQPNSTSTRRQRITLVLRVILAANGLCLVGIALLADLLGAERFHIGLMQLLLAAIGLMYLVLGGILQRLPFFVSQVCLVPISASMLVLFIEGLSRIFGYDFNNSSAA